MKLHQLALGASLLGAACASPAPHSPESAPEERSGQIAVTPLSLAERYARLKQEGDALDKNLLDQSNEDPELFRACWDTHQACAVQVVSLSQLFTKKLDTSACDGLDTEQKLSCRESAMVEHEDFAHLIVLQETSNACTRVISGCYDLVERIIRQAEQSEFPLVKKVSPDPLVDSSAKTWISAFIGQSLATFLDEQLCGMRDASVQEARRQAERASGDFFRIHQAEVERCEQKPPKGLELVDGACKRHVLQQYPKDTEVIKESGRKAGQAHERCLEKLSYQISLGL